MCPYPKRSLHVHGSSGALVGFAIGNEAGPTREEKSDHPIGALKPGNAGGAKGVMV
jgi:hypothetical protein